MARPVRSTSCLVVWPMFACLAASSPLLADEPGRPNAETKMLAVAKAVGHLASQRPEAVLGLVAVLGSREEATEPVGDLTGLKPNIRVVIGATSIVGTRDSLMDFAMIRHG